MSDDPRFNEAYEMARALMMAAWGRKLKSDGEARSSKPADHLEALFNLPSAPTSDE